MRMYLTKISIDTECIEILRNYTDSNYWHKNIMSGFQHTGYEGKDKRSKEQVLFRIMGTLIYVQSNVKPVYDGLDWVLSYETKCIDRLLDSFKVGGVYQLDTVCALGINQKTVKASRRWFTTDEERLNWLYDRGKSCGFEVVNAYTDCYNKVVLEKVGGKDYKAHLVRMQMQLRVTDAVKFKQFYCDGIGREKAYGAGLLMVVA